MIVDLGSEMSLWTLLRDPFFFFSPRARARECSGLEHSCSRVLQTGSKRPTLEAARIIGSGIDAGRRHRECVSLVSAMSWERQKRRGRLGNYPDRPAACTTRREVRVAFIYSPVAGLAFK